MFEVAVNTRRALVEQKELITSHSAGIQVHFTFSEDWDDLTRYAIFRNGEDGVRTPVIVPRESNRISLPPEVCAEAYIDEPVFVGIYGTDGEVGVIRIPTIWVSLGVLREGATTDGLITPPQPTPDMWGQITRIAEDALEIATECEDGEEVRNANEEQRQQNELDRQAEFAQMKANALPYVLEPSVSAVIYNPDAPEGSRISPAVLSVSAYRIDAEGDRAGYTADLFWYICTAEGLPVATDTQYNTNSMLAVLPQTITDEATIEFYIQKSPEEIGLPDTLARITVPIIKAGTKGDPGDDGVSPEVTITSITDGHRVTITDADHPTGQNFDVMDGADGTDGDDGYSPAVTITEITGGHRVVITDEAHPTGQSFDVMDGVNTVDDVQIDGTSIVSNGVANIPKAGSENYGVVKTDADVGIGQFYDGRIFINSADGPTIKSGSNSFKPIVPMRQDQATFYGLAKAAGDFTQSASSNPIGTYTDGAKAKIKDMIGATAGDIEFDDTETYSSGSIGAEVSAQKNAIGQKQDAPSSAGTAGQVLGLDSNLNPAWVNQTGGGGGMNIVTLTGTQITQTGEDNTFYVCGELTELTFTAPAVGITMIRFTSGTTPTVCTINGVNSWMYGFDPDTDIEASKTYDINVLNGIGVAGWA